MDIHKPKPWHNVREFLKEYAIIVVGVLTALAAEQAVEWLHWQHEVEVAVAAAEFPGEENPTACQAQAARRRRRPARPARPAPVTTRLAGSGMAGAACWVMTTSSM